MRLSLCWQGHEQTLRSSRGHNTFQSVQLLDSGSCCHSALKVRPCWTSVRERKDNIGALLVEVFPLGEAVSK